MTKTKEIMSRDMITVTADESMAEAYRIMHQNNIRHLPVVDERQKIVGILSDRDIQRSMNVKKLNNFQQAVTIDKDLKVEDFMSWPVYTVSESTSIERVTEEMLAQKVSAFVVGDVLGHHKGIITTDDLLTFLLTMIKNDGKMRFKPLSEYLFHPGSVD